MILETYAKVNLTLEVLRRRPDGFHDLATIFCAIGLADRLTIAPADGLRVTCDHPEVPDGEGNLCWQAAERLAEATGVPPRAAIHIAKQVPPGGGVGGGSANAAGVLAGLARFWGVPAEPWLLRQLAAGLGSDVAFFIDGGCAEGRRRGELLEPLPTPVGVRFVLLAPSRPVSTAAVYGALTGFRDNAGSATAAVAEALRRGEVPDPGGLVNDLEAPACAVSAELAADRARLDELGLTDARLCGSGGSWYVMTSLHDSGAVRRRLAEAWPARPVQVADPVTLGWRILSEE